MSDALQKAPAAPHPATGWFTGNRAVLAVLLCVLAVIYARTSYELYVNWKLVDSYYTHGFLVPFVSLYFAYRQRETLKAMPIRPSAWGIVWIVVASLMLLIGDFLGFRVFGHLSLIPMLIGVLLVFAGSAITMRLWFPILFLFFMIPIPPSLTQSIALQLKLVAAECAVRMANVITLPMVREGSYIYFGTDRLLVGDVCGGLRSLIALLALGALAAYISPTKAWARIAILMFAAPIAVAANIVRIFFLCVVGYFYGSEIAGGKVHDYSGFLIYAVAIALFTAIDVPLRRFATAAPRSESWQTGASLRRNGLIAAAMGVLVLVAAGHVKIVSAQSLAHMETAAPAQLNIPKSIADYRQIGDDFDVDQRTREILETSAILIRNYGAQSGRYVQLSIVHAGSTRRSLHFPEVCLVGDGWEIVKQQEAPVGILFTAKRLVLVRGDKYEAVLYWFKTGDHVTGNYFRNAFEWAKNQMLLGDPSSAMIKLTTPFTPGNERAAFATLDDFASKFSSIMFEDIK